MGPIGIWIGSAISALVYTIHGYLGWLSVAIMGALWPLLVMTGMHRVFTPTIIQTIAETGKEGMVMPSDDIQFVPSPSLPLITLPNFASFENRNNSQCAGLIV